MTKRKFRELTNYQRYTGGDGRFHCFYFDWKQGEYGQNRSGYKYAITCNAIDYTKAGLFSLFYGFLYKSESLPPYVWIRTASSDETRFKVGISLDLDLFE